MTIREAKQIAKKSGFLVEADSGSRGNSELRTSYCNKTDMTFVTRWTFGDDPKDPDKIECIGWHFGMPETSDFDAASVPGLVYER